jgi:hypothetical protein
VRQSKVHNVQAHAHNPGRVVRLGVRKHERGVVGRRVALRVQVGGEVAHLETKVDGEQQDEQEQAETHHTDGADDRDHQEERGERHHLCEYEVARALVDGGPGRRADVE